MTKISIRMSFVPVKRNFANSWFKCYLFPWHYLDIRHTNHLVVLKGAVLLKRKILAESLIIKVGGRGISIQIVFMRRCLTGCLKDETTCHLKKDMTKVVGGMKVQIGQGTIFPVAGSQGAWKSLIVKTWVFGLKIMVLMFTRLMLPFLRVMRLVHNTCSQVVRVRVSCKKCTQQSKNCQLPKTKGHRCSFWGCNVEGKHR